MTPSSFSQPTALPANFPGASTRSVNVEVGIVEKVPHCAVRTHFDLRFRAQLNSLTKLHVLVVASTAPAHGRAISLVDVRQVTTGQLVAFGALIPDSSVCALLVLSAGNDLQVRRVDASAVAADVPLVAGGVVCVALVLDFEPFGYGTNQMLIGDSVSSSLNPMDRVRPVALVTHGPRPGPALGGLTPRLIQDDLSCSLGASWQCVTLAATLLIARGTESSAIQVLRDRAVQARLGVSHRSRFYTICGGT